MFCPKCGASLKEGAKFCHTCGFNMTETPAAPPAQPQQQPQQPQSPSNPGQGFDISKVPVKDWIHAGIAFTGVICTFLPWGTAGYGYFRFSISGIDSTFGVLSLLVFLGIAGVVIAGKLIGLAETAKNQILKFAPLGVASFLFFDILRLVVRSRGALSPGFGLILAIIISIALILFGFKVIKLK